MQRIKRQSLKVPSRWKRWACWFHIDTKTTRTRQNTLWTWQRRRIKIYNCQVKAGNKWAMLRKENLLLCYQLKDWSSTERIWKLRSTKRWIYEQQSISRSGSLPVVSLGPTCMLLFQSHIVCMYWALLCCARQHQSQAHWKGRTILILMIGSVIHGTPTDTLLSPDVVVMRKRELLIQYGSCETVESAVENWNITRTFRTCTVRFFICSAVQGLKMYCRETNFETSKTSNK